MQRADVFDAAVAEKQRHPGAGSFVGSSTVKNDLAVEREEIVLLGQLLGIDMQGTGDGFGVGFEIEGMAQVDDGEIFTGIDFVLELIDSDAADAQIAKESLTGNELREDIGCQSGSEQDEQPTAERGGTSGNEFDLLGEEVTQAEKGSGPKEGAESIEKQETAKAHVKDAGEGSGDGA